jgi:hypothetical protein
VSILQNIGTGTRELGRKQGERWVEVGGWPNLELGCSSGAQWAHQHGTKLKYTCRTGRDQ